MDDFATLIMLLAMIGFFIGLTGLIKGKVKFLKLQSRKKSGIFTLGMFGLFIVGSIILSATYEPVPQSDTATENKEKLLEENTPGIQKPEIDDEQPIDQEEVNDKELNDQEENTVEEDSESETKNDETENTDSSSTQVTGTGDLKVHFVNVGQGAAQVIVTPNKKVMVIDGGNNDDEDDIVAYLKQLGVKKVDILIGTHPDADHIGGIDAVIDTFNIGQIYMPKVERDTQTFESVLLSIAEKGLSVKTAKAGLTLDLDPNVNVKMIAPIGTDSDANEMSAVVRISYGNHSFLLTGDAGFPTEEKLLKSGTMLKSTVLLVGHHGSRYSTGNSFLHAVKPSYSVIQVGKNSYGHPDEEVLQRLTDVASKIYRNDTDGTIIFTSNGSKMEVNKNAWVYTGTKAPTTNKPKAEPPKTEPQKEERKETQTTGNFTVTAAIDNAKPSQNEHVAVTVTVKDSNNKAVSGAKVTLTLQFKSKDTVYESITDSSGKAVLDFSIGRASSGFTVEGDIKVTAHGKTATASTSFTPQ